MLSAKRFGSTENAEVRRQARVEKALSRAPDQTQALIRSYLADGDAAPLPPSQVPEAANFLDALPRKERAALWQVMVRKLTPEQLKMLPAPLDARHLVDQMLMMLRHVGTETLLHTTPEHLKESQIQLTKDIAKTRKELSELPAQGAEENDKVLELETKLAATQQMMEELKIIEAEGLLPTSRQTLEVTIGRVSSYCWFLYDKVRELQREDAPAELVEQVKGVLADRHQELSELKMLRREFPEYEKRLKGLKLNAALDIGIGKEGTVTIPLVGSLAVNEYGGIKGSVALKVKWLHAINEYLAHHTIGGIHVPDHAALMVGGMVAHPKAAPVLGPVARGSVYAIDTAEKPIRWAWQKVWERVRRNARSAEP